MYFGWVTVVLGAIVYMIVIGTTFNAFGLFVLPVSEEFRLSRANMNTALILLNFGGAALAPFIGWLIDRVAARKVMIAGALLFGASLVGLGLSRSLLVSAIIIAVPLAIAVSAAGTITVSALLARWFIARRGKALVLAAMGMSMSGILVAPVIGWLIQVEGWRFALVTIGVASTLVLLAIAFFVRERPTGDELLVEQPPAGAAGAAAAAPARALSVAEMLRMPQFWSIGLSTAVALGIAQAITITLVPLAIEGGVTTLQATTLISIAGGAAIAAKLLVSQVADRIDRIVLLGVLFALGAFINGLLFTGGGFALLATCAVMLGVCSGTVAPLFYTVLADRFGVASFGTVRGLMTPLTALAGAIIVRFAGEVFDRTGGYALLFASFVVASLVAAALMFATRFTRSVHGAPALRPA